MTASTTNQLWPYAPSHYDDELLSSYMVRLAHAHGTSPSRFFHYHVPSVEVWNRDIDSSCPLSLMATIADRSDVSVDAIRSLSLVEVARHCLTRVGVYHRTRTRAGLRFCPDCLAEASYVRRAWRSAWIGACSVHRKQLLDHCTVCHSIYMPHRALAMERCFACDTDLRKAGSQMSRVSIHTLQQNAATVLPFLNASRLFAFGKEVCLSLAAASVIYHAMRRACMRSTVARRVCMNSRFGRAMQLPCPSFSDIPAALAHLDALHELLEDGISGLESLAQDFALRREHFLPIDQKAPALVNELVEKLQTRSKASAVVTRTPSRRDALRQKIFRLHKQRKGGWREERAALLGDRLRGTNGH